MEDKLEEMANSSSEDGKEIKVKFYTKIQVGTKQTDGYSPIPGI